MFIGGVFFYNLFLVCVWNVCVMMCVGGYGDLVFVVIFVFGYECGIGCFNFVLFDFVVFIVWLYCVGLEMVILVIFCFVIVLLYFWIIEYLVVCIYVLMDKVRVVLYL